MSQWYGDAQRGPAAGTVDDAGFERQRRRYWDDRPIPAHIDDADIPTLVYCRKGAEALIIATSYATSDATAHMTVDWQTLGLDPSAPCTDAETGAPITVTNAQIIFPIKKHDIKIIHLGQAQ